MSNFKKSHISKIGILILFSLTLINCQGIDSLIGNNQKSNVQLITSVKNATPTPTPFQPNIGNASTTPNSPLVIQPILTGTPDSNIDGSYYGPPGSIPPRAAIIQQPENQISILLMGSDQRPNDGGFRTDVLLLVTLNFDDNSVNLSSFPRDLYVFLPGYTMDRINTAQVKGGFALTAATFEYNFGIRPDNYAIINFSGFENLINTLGGIDVNVGHLITDLRDGYGSFTIYSGINHMSGDTALWYVRSRHSSNDLDRTVRQQEVIQAIFSKLLSFDVVTKVPQLYSQFRGVIQTDLELGEIIDLSQFGTKFLDSWEISRYVVNYQHITNWTNPYTGAQVLLPANNFIEDFILKVVNAD